MGAKNILVFYPSLRDLRELKQYNSHSAYNFILHDHSSDELHDPSYLDHLVRRYASADIAGLLYSKDYPASFFGPLLSRRLGLPGPDPESIMLCHNKYYSRQIQKKHVPHAVPEFFLINSDELMIDFPFFVKPVKSCFSIGARSVINQQELCQALNDPQVDFKKFKPFTREFEQLMGQPSYGDFYLGEGILEGVQCTLEGFVHNGSTHILGIIDSVMFPNMISFKRFEYPSRLPASAQEDMYQITEKLIAGLSLDNSFFNIEFMYNPATKKSFIIEINPRLCSQFADFYQKVDGKNSYELLFDLVTGKSPSFCKQAGQYQVAASCILRTFQNQRVARVPSKDDVARLQDLFPDSRFEQCCIEGKQLSQVRQDGQSFLYGLIHLGAQDWQELYNSFEQARNILGFKFESV